MRSDQQETPVRTRQLEVIHRLCFLFAAAYFLWIAWPSFDSRLAWDDPMNLYKYWSMGPWKVAWSNLIFFTTAYRPMGGVFYLPIYGFAHLNPLPYHVVLDFILAADTWLLYRFAVLLGLPAPAAGFAALLSCSHVAMISLFLSPSDLYDALCFLFFFGALVYYVRIRSAGRLLNWRQTAAFLALYICALDSKEIGVTLPVFAVIYELLYHPPSRSRLRAWIANEGRAGLFGCILAVVYTLGKMLGPDSLAAMPNYRPIFTFHQFIANNAHFLDDLTYRTAPWFTPTGLFLLWALTGVWVWLSKERSLRFCWFFILVSPLPIAFIPQRGLYNLYLPLAGWAILVGAAAWDLVRLLSPERLVGYPASLALRIVLAFLLIFNWSRDRAWRASFSITASADQQQMTWEVIQQLRLLNIPIRHGSRVIFLHDPFHDWDMYFIAALWYRDPSLQFFLQRQSHLPNSEIDRIDYVFDWDKNRIVLVRSPKVT
jgi:hypothetical protein